MPRPKRKKGSDGRWYILGSDGEWYLEGHFLDTGAPQHRVLQKLNEDPARYAKAAKENTDNIVNSSVKSVGAAGGFWAGTAAGAAVGGPVGAIVGGLVGMALGWKSGEELTKPPEEDDDDD